MLSQELRPQTWDEVAGQQLVKTSMKAIIANPDKAPRSIIFSGPFGTGKTTSCRIFAKALNCPSVDSKGNPCNKPTCPICSQNLSESSFYVEYDSSIVGNVEKIRELRDTFYYTTANQYKVIVFDECFSYNTKVLTVQGGKKVYESIGKIVNGSKPYKVVCMDSNGNTEVKPIIGWHKLKSTQDIKRYYFRRKDIIDYYDTKDKEVFIEATPNHPVYTGIGVTKPISKLNIGDTVLGYDEKTSIKRLKSIRRKHSYYNINEEVFQILLGCTLGDGGLSINKHYENSNPRFIFSQSDPRLELFNRVKKVLGDMLSASEHIEVDGTGWSKNNRNRLRSKCVSELGRVKNLTYDAHMNRLLHKELFDIINPIGLAFHFMSDGFVTNNTLNLSMHRYRKECVERYQHMLLSKYGIDTKLNKDIRCFNGEYANNDGRESRGYYLSTVDFDNFTKYASIISPYLTPDCMYKINNLFPIQDLTQYTNPIKWVEPEEYNIHLGDYTLDRVEDIGSECHDSYVYDLTVEGNHNYVVNSILVHNCHVASKSSQTALLKVLEDAPAGVFFIFATTHPQQLLPTILSRSLELKVSKVPISDIENNIRLASDRLGIKVDESIIKLIAHKSKGHMRNCHMLLDMYSLVGEEAFKDSVKSSREILLKYLISIVNKNTAMLFQSIDELQTFPVADIKDDLDQLLLDMIKALVEKGNNPLSKLAQAYNIHLLKLIKNVSSDWVKNSFNDDISAQTALLALYQLISDSMVVKTKQEVRGKN